MIPLYGVFPLFDYGVKARFLLLDFVLRIALKTHGGLSFCTLGDGKSGWEKGSFGHVRFV